MNDSVVKENETVEKVNKTVEKENETVEKENKTVEKVNETVVKVNETNGKVNENYKNSYIPPIFSLWLFHTCPVLVLYLSALIPYVYLRHTLAPLSGIILSFGH